MALAAAELHLVAEEIDALCAGARLQKIHQPAPDRLVLRLFREDEERAVLLVARPGLARAHLTRRDFENPRTPPPFCAALRELLKSARLVRAASAPGDRTLKLDFDVFDGTRVVRRTLVAELFGPRPNLALVDAAQRVLAVLDERPGGPRPLVVDGVYEPPAPPERDPAPRPPWSDFGDAFRPRALVGGALSEALDDWFAPRDAEAALAEARASLADDLGRSRRKLRRLLENLEADRAAIARIDDVRREGELLKANLGLLRRGMKEVELDDWSSGEARRVVVRLDPAKAPQEQASSRFEEARRLERSAETTALRYDAATSKMRDVEDALAALDAAPDVPTVVALRARCVRDGLCSPPPPPPKPPAAVEKPSAAEEARKCYRVFRSADGLDILVGRAASDNDELTFKVANGDDFWFHVRDYAGSHVVVRARPELPPETLLDAATLAVHFSKADFAGKRDVSWTRRKFVAKPRGAPPGQVLLSQHKTLHLRADPARLKRLIDPGKV
ncbi:MAG TPA: NFACT family protein [Planctomycetota bacterium]|nr:NFACT family protein [Planctomycetota bacterium]